MKKLYFLVVLAMSFGTQAQIVNIPDANFKAKLLSASPSNHIASIQTPNSSTFLSSYNSIDTNNDGEIQVSEALLIKYLDISYSYSNSFIGIESFINLIKLNCSDNFLLQTYDLTALTNLKFLKFYSSNLTSLNLNGLSNLVSLDCSTNFLTSLDLTGLVSLENLDCDLNQITNLDLSNLINLKTLSCVHNSLNNINFNNLTNPQLTSISCSFNQLTDMNASGFNNLTFLSFVGNQVSNLNINGSNNIQDIYCDDNQLTTINVNELNNLQYFECDNNLLISLFIKGYNPYSISFSNNPTLQYICTDESRISILENYVYNYGYTNCHVNSYCTFVPGGIYYEIYGNTKFDSTNNGCDSNDNNCSKLNLSITDGTNSGTIISNTSGNYFIPVTAGNHTVTPIIENPTYFNISPTNFVANFPTQTSPQTQDFCVTANGVHHDVEVVYVSTVQARPGFDANYTIIYKNKGNQIENGTVTLDFNDTVLDLVSSNPTFSSQATNTLTWNYTNLQPLETRIINLVFNVNSPMETPAVNIGDQLDYTATITPLGTDEVQYDNTSAIKQIVVGSYDPNDKTCIEGTTVGPDMIGQYVHYVIRFENTGTYPAENIVVKDLIDLSKFDVATLIPLHSSHDFVTRIAGNKVEFIFEGINLPFDDANNDGYVVFKIKTKSNLVVGDTFSNDANIYFDYNFPITTNTFTTTIAALKVTDFDFRTHFTLYPNPVKDVLNFQSKDNTTINSIEIYNTLGQVVLAVPNAISSVDVSGLESGNYFVKVNTDLGVSNTKFIKE